MARRWLRSWAKVVHGKGEECVDSMMVICHKDDRFIDLVLTVAASVVAGDGVDGD